MSTEITGTYDQAGATFELEGQSLTWQSAGSLKPLQAQLNQMGWYAFTSFPKAKPTIVHSDTEPVTVSFPGYPGELVLLKSGLVRTFKPGEVVYLRIFQADGTADVRKVITAKKLVPWDFNLAVVQLMAKHVPEEVATQIVCESGPDWKLVFETVIGVIGKFAGNRRDEVQRVTAGAIAAYYAAAKQPIMAARRYLSGTDGWPKLDTDPTVMKYLHVMQLVATLDELPGGAWAVEEVAELAV